MHTSSQNLTGLVLCPACGRKHLHTPEIAGRRARCKCGKSFDVAPLPTAVRVTPELPSVAPAPPAAGHQVDSPLPPPGRVNLDVRQSGDAPEKDIAGALVVLNKCLREMNEQNKETIGELVRIRRYAMWPALFCMLLLMLPFAAVIIAVVVALSR